MFRSSTNLAIVALLGTALLTGVHHLTAERIAAEERRVITQQLEQIIDPDLYDNPLHEDFFHFSDETFFPGTQKVTAYRARANGKAVAVVLKFAAVNGYNGNIHLLVGINLDGTLGGVRVSSHKETPGLGDAIEERKSDWILAFSGRSLKQPEPGKWAVKRDGGDFDQFTGATITPRAIVEAVRRALEYYAEQKSLLYETPGEATVKDLS
jgi:electron transport complex protein RnfG